VNKLVYRHPHIFSTVKVKDSNEVLANWDEIKRKEKHQATVTSSMDSVAKSLPALWRAEKVQKKAAKVGFDWPDASGAMDKVSEEFSELSDAVKTGVGIREELGDLLFAVVNAARLLDIDPEDALTASTEKFINRFSCMEKLADERELDLHEMSLSEMDNLYNEAKSILKSEN